MSEDKRAILKQIKDYILEGSEQAADFINECEYEETQIGLIATNSFFSGKIAAYNDIYDWIENVLEQEAE